MIINLKVCACWTFSKPHYQVPQQARTQTFEVKYKFHPVSPQIPFLSHCSLHIASYTRSHYSASVSDIVHLGQVILYNSQSFNHLPPCINNAPPPTAAKAPTSNLSGHATAVQMAPKNAPNSKPSRTFFAARVPIFSSLGSMTRHPFTRTCGGIGPAITLPKSKPWRAGSRPRVYGVLGMPTDGTNATTLPRGST